MVFSSERVETSSEVHKGAKKNSKAKRLALCYCFGFVDDTNKPSQGSVLVRTLNKQQHGFSQKAFRKMFIYL